MNKSTLLQRVVSALVGLFYRLFSSLICRIKGHNWFYGGYSTWKELPDGIDESAFKTCLRCGKNEMCSLVAAQDAALRAAGLMEEEGEGEQ